MVEVTQEDREAAEAWKWVLWNREEDDPGKAMEKNVDELAQDFARHRIAAENAALERAAKVADDHCYMIDIDEWMAMTKKEHGAYACRSVATAIRALKGPSNAD